MAKTGGGSRPAKKPPKPKPPTIQKKRPIMGGTVVGPSAAGATLGTRAAQAGQAIAQFGPAAVVAPLKSGLNTAGISRPGVAKNKRPEPPFTYRNAVVNRVAKPRRKK